MAAVRKLSSPQVEQQCFALTSRVFCSHCDADVGTGVINHHTLCLNFCDEWFYACRNDWIDPYIDKHEYVPFCREDSMVCSPVLEAVDSSRQFCEMMGFKVVAPIEGQDESTSDSQNCYNGMSR